MGKIRRSRKSKRVTWASDDNLCQVIFFSPKQAPSEIGDHELPPGFKEIHSTNIWRVKLSQIPMMKWRCPPRFVMDSEWNVVAGEGSQEIEAENHRQMRVFEAIYPRPSSIPPNPSVSVNVEDTNGDDHYTPLIPLTPIEEDNPSERVSLSDEIPATTPALASVKPNGLNNGSQTLIDPQLLIEILSNPKLTEQLLNSHHNAIPSSAPYVPNIRPPLNPAIDPIKGRTAAATMTTTLTTTLNPTHIITPNVSMAMAAPSGPVYRPTQIQTHISAEPCSITKDANYCKRLIQEHGEDKDKHQEHPSNSFLKSKRRNRSKPCVYFNSSKGCRNGANCSYQHIIRTSQQRFTGDAEVKSSKRMKLDGGIPCPFPFPYNI